MAFDERTDDGGGTMNFPDDICNVVTEERLVVVKMRDVDVFCYYHQPSDGSTPYLVIDVDTDSDDDEGLTPMRIYRNDGLIHQEGA